MTPEHKALVERANEHIAMAKSMANFGVASKLVAELASALASQQPADPPQVTDAMVEAARKAADDALWKWRGLGKRKDGEGLDGMHFVVRAALTAAIGAGGQAVAVKPLEWQHFDSGNAFAHTPFLAYCANTDGTWLFRNGVAAKVGDDLEAAKAAAQADYERRILSALSQPRPHPADERVVEALRIAEERLSSLLARIHRDGGHCEAAYGTEKAWTDADEIIARIYADDTHPAHSPAALAQEGRKNG